MKNRQGVALRGLVLVALLVGSRPLPGAAATFEEQAYLELDQVREGKRIQLTSYLERVEKLADQAGADPFLNRYFSLKKRYWELQQQAPPPAEARRNILELRASLREHYLREYQAFYDILFVDRSGFVLSTVRNQEDYHKNLFEGKLAETSLSRRLHDEPDIAFVDYEFYWASDEPSAFFVKPVVDAAGQPLGWLVLQCALNRINEIFVRGEGLGQTGETFLVNRGHQMLTESRLLPTGEGEMRRLSQENIDAKFRERSGHKRVIDYRGYPVLTSFAVYEVLGSEWLLVTKIDEDEVVTRYFREHAAALQPALVARLGASEPTSGPAQTLPDDLSIVDMDEFRFSHSQPLATFGVSTCTAVVVALPGQLAYLSHASINDVIYGARDQDVLGQMLRRIRRFEILPYQVRDLSVVAIAPHRASIAGVITQVLDAGLLLSQVRFLCNPAADYATVVHDPVAGDTRVRWTAPDGGGESWQSAADGVNLGAIARDLIAGRAAP